MKWVKSRNLFLTEAKIRDLVHKKQKAAIIETWGERYLDYEEVDPTDKITQGKWKLDDEDKIKFLESFFLSCDLKKVFEFFKNLDDHFSEILLQSIDLELIKEKSGESYMHTFSKFDPKSPNLDQLINLSNSVFRKLSVGETKSNEIISRDVNNRPILDKDGNMVKISKNPGDPVFSKNLVGIIPFISEYNICYSDKYISYSIEREINKIIDISSSNFNPEYHIGHSIFDNDIYLSISHNPKDILNISISKFYSSCQHLYSGDYKRRLLANVFDPNTIPAFFIIETPITLDGEIISDILPIARTLIRSCESYESNDSINLRFDSVYPSRCQSVVYELISKYSGNVNNTNIRDYTWFADLDDEDLLESPYMDTMSLKRGKYIGVNSKYFKISGEMSKYKISPRSKIEYLEINSEDVPSNFFQTKLDLKKIKFNSIKINSLSNFTNVKSNDVYLNKCKIDLSDLENCFDLKNLYLNGCDVSGSLKNMKLKHLEIIFSTNSNDSIEDLINGSEFESLTISSDILGNERNKLYINSIKSKVSIKGPII